MTDARKVIADVIERLGRFHRVVANGAADALTGGRMTVWTRSTGSQRERPMPSDPEIKKRVRRSPTWATDYGYNPASHYGRPQKEVLADTLKRLKAIDEGRDPDE